MDFIFNEQSQLTQINISKEDICAQCFPEIREVCPLLMCIVTNNVYPSAGNLQFNSCCMYEYIKERKGNKTS